jgi:penicillin-binding protein 2
VYRDWKAGGHGFVNLHQALVHSCDVYFYTIGQRMGIDTIASYAHQFGLGEETGVELPSERVGIVPSTEWKQRARHEPWLPGETISASIGQGYVTVTPLQMASLIGTVANDGVLYRPRLVQGIMDRTTSQLQQLPVTPKRKLTVKRQAFELIQDALAGVVREGTGTRAKSSIVTIAGKTGTAQTTALRTGPEKDIPKKFRDHAWFVAFAPVEAPRIAVAVLAEHMGHGGSAAAPLAKEVIEMYMKLSTQAPAMTAMSSFVSGTFTAEVVVR